jgi:hypothetical protein
MRALLNIGVVAVGSQALAAYATSDEARMHLLAACCNPSPGRVPSEHGSTGEDTSRSPQHSGGFATAAAAAAAAAAVMRLAGRQQSGQEQGPRSTADSPGPGGGGSAGTAPPAAAPAGNSGGGSSPGGSSGFGSGGPQQVESTSGTSGMTPGQEAPPPGSPHRCSRPPLEQLQGKQGRQVRARHAAVPRLPSRPA